MRQFHLLLPLIAIAMCASAQQKEIFKDDFDSNANNWFVGKIKKSAVELHDGNYAVYNDEGKNPIVSLVALPFDETKNNYTIQAEMTANYIPGEGMYGVMFAAEDEKNGYAVLFNHWSFFRLVKIENGKIVELNLNTNSAGKSENKSITIFLDDWQWKFMLDGNKIYSCDPLPWQGHKVGFYSSAESGYTASSLTVSESKATSNACPVTFTQEKFNEQLNKVACAAANNFKDILPPTATVVHSDSIWLDPVIAFDGAIDVSVVKIKGSTKQYMVVYQCHDSTDKDIAVRFFNELAKGIDKATFSCWSLTKSDVREDVNETIQRDLIWYSKKNSDLALIELALHHASDHYETIIHLYARK